MSIDIDATARPAPPRLWDPEPLPVRRRRRPWLMALGALLSSVGALMVVWLVAAAGQRVDVLVVRQPVAQGEVLTGAALAVARVSVDPGVDVLPAADRQRAEGLRAGMGLQPGMLLSPDMLTAERGPGAGRVLVPLAIAADRMPSGGLLPGDHLLVVDAGDAANTAAVGSARPAVVARVGPPDVNGVSVIDVDAAAADGPSLAVMSANSRAALVVEPAGSRR